MGTPELLEQGREPEGGVGASRPRVRAAAWGAVVVAAVVGLGAWYVRADGTGAGATGPTASASAGTATATRGGSALAPFPSPAGTPLVSGLAEARDLEAPAAPALDSFIASGGHALLFLQIRNTSPDVLRIVDGLVPQPGVSRDLTAGGLSSGTSKGQPLGPGETAEVFLRLRMQCPDVLDGPAVRAVILVAERPGQQPHLERVDVTALGPWWDEARHAGCRTADPGRDVTLRPVPGSVTATLVTPGVADVSARLAVHDAAGFAAVVAPAAPDAHHGQDRMVVDGGATREVPLSFTAVDCLAALPPLPAYRVELPNGSASVLPDVSTAIVEEWRAALDLVCGG